MSGAAKALAEVLRARRPDLAWDVTVAEPGYRHPSPAAAAEIRRLIARRDDVDALAERRPPGPDPDRAEGAA